MFLFIYLNDNFVVPQRKQSFAQPQIHRKFIPLFLTLPNVPTTHEIKHFQERMLVHPS